MRVKKRDGRMVQFDSDRISLAIRKAMEATVKGVDQPLIEKIVEKAKSQAEKRSLDVEKIQDLVENELMKSSRKDVAKEYIAYRHQRNLAREAKTKDVFMSIISAENNEITRENANMCAETPAGMMIKFASETTKPFADNYLLTEEALMANRGNYIHPHDKDYMVTRSLTCLQHPLDRILENGFKAGHGESRAAKRIETASILAAISMETVQNEMHGGQAIPAYDFYMAPYIRMTYIEEFEKASELYGYDINVDVRDREIKDYVKKNLTGISDPFERIRQQAINQTVKRTHQASESLIHNLNTIHSRGGEVI